MECLQIDWKNIDLTFVKDEFYETIQAPMWVDFTAPEQQVDDTEWFCQKAGCVLPNKAASEHCSLFNTEVEPKEKCRTLDPQFPNKRCNDDLHKQENSGALNPESRALTHTAVPFIEKAVSAATCKKARGIVSTCVTSLPDMNSKTLQKARVLPNGKIHRKRCQAGPENENPNYVPRQAFPTMASKRNIRIQHTAMKKSQKMETRDLLKVSVTKIAPTENLIESQKSKMIGQKDALLNVPGSDSDSKKPVTGEKVGQQGHFARQFCMSSRCGTIPPPVPSNRVLVNRRLVPDSTTTDKPRQSRKVGVTDKSGPLSMLVNDVAFNHATTTSSSALRETCADVLVVNQVIKQKDGDASAETDASCETGWKPSEINDNQEVSAGEMKKQTEVVPDCKGEREVEEEATVEQKKHLVPKGLTQERSTFEDQGTLEGRLRGLRLASCECAAEDKTTDEQQATNKGKKRKSTQLTFKLNCSSKEHGKKSNKMVLSHEGASTCLLSSQPVSFSRKTAGACAGHHKRLRTVHASALSPAQLFKPFKLRTEARRALRELEMNKKELCSLNLAETRLEANEEIKKLRGKMVHHALKMPFFGKPFKPQRSTKKLTVPKEPNFHVIRSRKTCIKQQHLVSSS